MGFRSPSVAVLDEFAQNRENEHALVGAVFMELLAGVHNIGAGNSFLPRSDLVDAAKAAAFWADDDMWILHGSFDYLRFGTLPLAFFDFARTVLKTKVPSCAPT